MQFGVASGGCGVWSVTCVWSVEWEIFRTKCKVQSAECVV